LVAALQSGRSYLGSATAPSCGNSYEEQLDAIPTFSPKETTKKLLSVLKKDFNGLNLGSKILLRKNVAQCPAGKQKIVLSKRNQGH